MPRRREGLSLVEVMVGLTVLLLALVLMVGLLPASTLSLKKSENRTFAGQLCQSELERRVAHQQLSVGTIPPSTVEHRGVSYRVEGTIAPESGSGGTALAGLFRVRVRASWRERGQDYEVVRETLVRQGN